MPIIDSGMKSFEIAMPSRGLLTAMPGQFMDQRFSPFVDNVRFYKGEVLNRPGLQDIPITPQVLAGVPTGGFAFEEPDRSFTTLVGTGGTSSAKRKIYWYNPATPTWTDITGAITFNNTSSDPWSFASALGLVTGTYNAYMANGVDALHYWDGAAAAVAAVVDASAYPARYLVEFGNRLVMAHMVEGGVTLADRVRWSADGDADTWTPTAANGAGAVDTVDLPGEITGMKRLSGVNYIYKRDGIIAMRLSGLLVPAFTFQTVVDGIGTLAGRTIVEINGVHYFLGDDDVYAFDGASRPVGIGTGIRTELFETLNYGRVRQAFAFHHATFNEYWLCIPTGTDTTPTNSTAFATRAYIYNYVEQAWGRADINMTCHTQGRTSGTPLTIDGMTFAIDDWVTAIDSGFGGTDVYFPILGTPEISSGTTITGDGEMLQIDDNIISDRGNDVTAVFHTPDVRLYPPNEPPRQSTLHRVILTVRDRGSGNYALEVSGDAGQTWTSLGSKTTPSVNVNALVNLIYYARFTSPFVRVRIQTDNPMAVQKIAYEYLERSELR